MMRYSTGRGRARNVTSFPNLSLSCWIESGINSTLRIKDLTSRSKHLVEQTHYTWPLIGKEVSGSHHHDNETSSPITWVMHSHFVFSKTNHKLIHITDSFILTQAMWSLTLKKTSGTYCSGLDSLAKPSSGASLLGSRHSSLTKAMHWLDTWYPSKCTWLSGPPTHRAQVHTNVLMRCLLLYFWRNCFHGKGGYIKRLFYTFVSLHWYCNEGLNDFKIIQSFFHSFLHTQKEEF